MVAPLKLEVLSSDDGPRPRTVFLPDDRLARIKNDVFQAGYDQGYAKARTELEAQKTELSAVLAQSLQAIDFTHFEARKAVLDTLEPLIGQMISLVLPGLITDALADVVAAQVLSVASLLTDGPVHLVCAPMNAPALELSLQSLTELPVQAIVVADKTCGEFEVRIKSPECERHIDIGRVIAGISQGATAFYKLSSAEQKTG